jgi:signal transduction histidine kinase
MENSTETQVVERRLAALSQAEMLIDRLHAEAELHRESLANAIHDELGGLMVSAAMDFTWVQQRAGELDSPVQERLERGKRTLQAAIDMSRRMVEELRPSILDNFGLFAALKWHLKQASEGSGAILTENFPEAEPHFELPALTALFRMAEEAVNLIFKRHGVTAAGIKLQIDNGTMTIQFSGDGIPVTVNGVDANAVSAMTSMQHRVRSLGGSVELVSTDGGGTLMKAYVPLRTSETVRL